jgi:hypothetical protein
MSRGGDHRLRNLSAVLRLRFRPLNWIARCNRICRSLFALMVIEVFVLPPDWSFKFRPRILAQVLRILAT